MVFKKLLILLALVSKSAEYFSTLLGHEFAPSDEIFGTIPITASPFERKFHLIMNYI